MRGKNMTTAIIYTQKYLAHNPGPDHPESAKRLKIIMKELKESGILENKNCFLAEPTAANIEDVKLIHTPEHIQLVERICKAGGGLLDLGDTVVSPQSFEVALHAVGGAIQAVDLVMKEKCQNAFAFVRPPGHHAGAYYAWGFCIFNNVAIAAKHLLERYKLERILILDIDAHHGNGTQEIFYDTNNVLYISLHQDPRGFPGTGFIDEIGEGEGLGYNVNIPFPFRINDQIYLAAINQLVMPIIEQYKPQFFLVSTGLDGHYSDPVARLSLSTDAYLQVFEKILEAASKLCENRLAAILEGGYSLRFIGKIASGLVAKMAGIYYPPVQDEKLSLNPQVKKEAEKILEEVKKVQSSFWNLC
jgi:acetoin utilization deacetylase AcuC-like enzyme